MTETAHSTFDFSDAHLKAALRRAIKVTAILGLVLAVVLTFVSGWQTGLLVIAGTIISVTGLWEWQRLVAFMNARLDNQRQPGGAVRVLSTFFLRLLLAGGILYGSLKCLHGSVYALVAGLALGIFALTVEAVRVIRS